MKLICEESQMKGMGEEASKAVAKRGGINILGLLYDVILNAKGYSNLLWN